MPPRTTPSYRITAHRACAARAYMPSPCLPPATATPFRSATFNSDPLHNFAAVADADVLVIVHGSGCANWLAMRERSAMLELR